MRKDLRLAFTIPFTDVKKSIENGKNSLVALVHVMNRTDCTEDEKSFASEVIGYIKALEDMLILLKDPER
jgi:hypothetical protein